MMEQPAVESGIPAQDYWSLTLDEINVQMMANKNIYERNLKEKAMFDYKAAQLNAYALNSPKDMPSIEKTYAFFNNGFEEGHNNALSEETEYQVPISETPYSMEQDKAIFMQMAKAVKQHNLNKEGE